MAKPWVEGGYYEECSGKWGWKNKETEKTKVKWLKNKLKENWNKKTKNTIYTSNKRRESLIQMQNEGENGKVKEYEKLGEIKW